MGGIVNVLALGATTNIEVKEGGWLGNLSSAGLGAILLWFSYKFAKDNRVLWSPGVTGKLNEKRDWTSLMSFLVGFICVTLILGSTDNLIRNGLVWLQQLIISVGSSEKVAFIGAPGICLILLLLALWKKGDSPFDIRMGSACGLLFPLGGGGWAQFSLVIGGFLANALNGSF